MQWSTDVIVNSTLLHAFESKLNYYSSCVFVRKSWFFVLVGAEGGTCWVPFIISVLKIRCPLQVFYMWSSCFLNTYRTFFLSFLITNALKDLNRSSEVSANLKVKCEDLTFDKSVVGSCLCFGDCRAVATETTSKGSKHGRCSFWVVL